MERTKKFEEKMMELENIVNELENGNTDLDDSINKYTKAMQLIKECDETLKNVENQVNKIVLENGQTEDFKIEE